MYISRVATKLVTQPGSGFVVDFGFGFLVTQSGFLWISLVLVFWFYGLVFRIGWLGGVFRE